MVKDTKKKESGYIAYVTKIDGMNDSVNAVLDILIKNGYLIRKVIRSQSLRSSQDLNKDLGITKEFTTYEVYERVEKDETMA